MNEDAVLSIDQVESIILLVRGQKVILDRDLAQLYGVTSGNLNKAVKRNIDRFPNNFIFQLTPEKYKSLRFRFGIFKKGQLMAPPDKKVKKIGFTVKEKQKVYVKGTKKKEKPPLDGSFTPKAKKIWEAIAGYIQIKILNNVWCVHCSKVSSIGNLTGKIESGMLVLRGTCTKCGGDVARIIENE